LCVGSTVFVHIGCSLLARNLLYEILLGSAVQIAPAASSSSSSSDSGNILVGRKRKKNKGSSDDEDSSDNVSWQDKSKTKKNKKKSKAAQDVADQKQNNQIVRQKKNAGVSVSPVAGIIFFHLFVCSFIEKIVLLVNVSTSVCVDKRKKKGEELDNKKEFNKALTNWVYTHSVPAQNCNAWEEETKRFQIPVEFLKRPTALEHLLAREEYAKQVDVIRVSMQQTGLIADKSHIIVCIFLEDLNLDPTTDPSTVKIEVKRQVDGTCGYDIFIYGGQHTTSAIKSMKDSGETEYDYAPVERILLCSKSQEDQAMLDKLGIRENMIASTASKFKPFEVVRKVFLNKQNLLGIYSNNMANFKKAFNLKKAEIRMGYNQNVKTFNKLAAIANVSQTTFDLLDKIFKGKVAQMYLGKPVKFQTPSGISHFSAMAKIPELNLNTWLQRIVQGQWTTLQFFARCEEWKSKEIVQNMAFSAVNDLMANPEQKFDDWKAVTVRFPALGTWQWLDRASTNIRSTPIAIFESSMKKEIRGIISRQLESEKPAKDVSDEKAEVYFIIFPLVYIY
jgi:hypothetical protein